MKISFFSSAQDNAPRVLDVTWSEFVSGLLQEGHKTPSSKLETMMFSPTEFAGPRSKHTAQRVHFGVVDLDHVSPETFQAALSHIDGLGLEYFVATSWSHSPPMDLCARVLVPFSRPIPAQDWHSFWPRFHAHLGGYGDVQCKDVSRCYFIPATSPERLPTALMHHSPGQPLNVDAVGAGEVSPDIILAAQSLVPISLAELQVGVKRLERKQKPSGLAWKRALQGEPWSEEGTRDTMLFMMCGDMAQEYPYGDPKSIVPHLRAALSHFEGDFSEQDVIDKWTRKQGEILAQIEQKQTETRSKRELAISAAFKNGRSHAYTPDEVQRFAAEAGCDVVQFSKRWIIQVGPALYVYVDGEYRGPISMHDGKLSAHTYLAPATSAGVRLEEHGADGSWIQRPVGDLVMDYGLPAASIRADMTASKTHFDYHTATLIEAPCPRRNIVPCYNRDIERWLFILGGPHAHYLFEWLSWVLTLDKACAALFLEGAPGTGKSLLAKGLARFWTEGAPTPLEAVLGNFNGALAQCPIVFADEKLPKDVRGRGRTAELREFIQAEIHPLRRKYQPDSNLHGAARVIVAANNAAILESGELNLTQHDMAAILGRIVHIQVSDDAADYLAHTDTTGWVSEDKIAAHVLHLIDSTIRPKNPPRFLVQAPEGAMHRAISTSTTMGSAVAHWLCAFVMDPMKLRAGRPPDSTGHMIFGFDGHLWVATRTIMEHWAIYPTGSKVDATLRNVGMALNGMSMGERKFQWPGHTSTNRPRFRKVKTADLIQWAERHGFCTREQLMERLYALCEKDAAMVRLED